MARIATVRLLLISANCVDFARSFQCPRGIPTESVSMTPAVGRFAVASIDTSNDKQPKETQPPQLDIIGSDWGGLPAAIQASKSAALNNRIVKAHGAEEVLRLTEECNKELTPVNIATALHRLGSHLKRQRAQRERALRDPRFIQLFDRATNEAASFSPRSVSDVMWSCATLGHWPSAILKPILTQIAVHLKSKTFEVQHLALIVWALATLECKPTILLEEIEKQAADLIQASNVQNRANLVWGYAKLNMDAPTLLHAVRDSLLSPRALDSAKPVEVADLLYGYAAVDEADPNLFDLLARQASMNKDLMKFSSRQLVTVIWSFARLGRDPPDGLLDTWIQQIQDSHEKKPLLATDSRSLEASLNALGRPTEWLHESMDSDEE